MAQLRTLKDLLKEKSSVKGKTVLVRADLNVPMSHGKVADDTRIRRTIPTLQALIKAKTKIVVLSHFGRPEGKVAMDLSLAPITDTLSEALEGVPVHFGVDCVGSAAKYAVEELRPGEVALLENLRFHKEEEASDPGFAKQLAGLGDYYVNDAFSCSHRAHASIEGIAKVLPAYAGLLLQDEVSRLEAALGASSQPIAALVGGAKISTKIKILERLVEKVDMLMVGGAMANTFLYAQGYKVGKSLYEKEYADTAKAIIAAAKDHNCTLMLPSDVVLADRLTFKAPCVVVDSDHVAKDKLILDIGPKTVVEWGNALRNCKTVVWNGPLGAFETSPFDVGTISMARFVAGLTHTGQIQSVAGGGDVLSALACAGLRNSFSYISTAGGAFLEWLEGKTLPGIKVLMR